MDNTISPRRQKTLNRRFDQLNDLEKDFMGLILENYFEEKFEEEFAFDEMIEGLSKIGLEKAVFVKAVTTLERMREKHNKPI